MTDSSAAATFASLGLPDHLLATLSSVGYEAPSPIQSSTIPPLMAGRDVLGQAQTGTGKTAAFALPILSRLDLTKARPQALVLTPTRELAIQVAEAFQRYAHGLPGFHVLPIYGGQGYGPQLHALARGTHVVVGTPGRIKDHLERGSLDLSHLSTAVLDEADEMLRMGFIDDVDLILGRTPPARQVALFSATMPPAIRRIAQTHLKNPVEITIQSKTTTASQVRQRYWLVSGINKLDALTRILEAEPFEAMIVFLRTKLGTEELAGKLEARGFAAAAINGDLVQAQREKTIARLRDGQLDILVATDVAARGLDVERVTHVLNYDIPHDSEGYVHRIGRTGRAGRSGEAILFVTPRERHLLRAIERATRQPIEAMTLPSVAAVNDQRIARFQQRITEGLAAEDLDVYRRLVEDYAHRHEVSELEIAAALARQLQGAAPLLLEAAFEPPPPPEPPSRGASRERFERAGKPVEPRARAVEAPRPSVSSVASQTTHDAARPARRTERPERVERPDRAERPERARPGAKASALPLERFRVEVGARHGLKPGNLVGAIANEAGLDSHNIGHIEIDDEHSFIELPEGMPKDIYNHLKKVWVVGRQLRISRVDAGAGVARPASTRSPDSRPPRRKS